METREGHLAELLCARESPGYTGLSASLFSGTGDYVQELGMNPVRSSPDEGRPNFPN
jgi:hypothetical protein